MFATNLAPWNYHGVGEILFLHLEGRHLPSARYSIFGWWHQKGDRGDRRPVTKAWPKTTGDGSMVPVSSNRAIGKSRPTQKLMIVPAMDLHFHGFSTIYPSPNVNFSARIRLEDLNFTRRMSLQTSGDFYRGSQDIEFLKWWRISHLLLVHPLTDCQLVEFVQVDEVPNP